MNMTQIYLLSPPTLELEPFSEALEELLETGHIPLFQLRLKGAEDDAISRACEVLLPLCQKHETGFILNDRTDLALSCGADGVHLGQNDGDVAAARALLGEEAVIGVSCQDSRHRAMEAGEQGADYVSFGAFYPTATKPEAESRPNPEILRWWSTWTNVPCVAIGGITADNAAPLAAAGVDFVAVSGSVWTHPDGPAAAVTRLQAVLAQAAEEG